jgi:hypothetical protein
VQPIIIQREIEDERKSTREEDNANLSIREILLLNKKSGLPIFSRVYRKSSGQDPALIAGLMAAIVQFGEMIGNNMELNDIGVQKGARIFVRSQDDLVCLLTIANFPFSYFTRRNYTEIVDDLTSRIFETIFMLISLPAYDSGIVEEISFDFTDKALEEKKSSIFPQLGSIIDNIVMETTTTLFVDENGIEKDLDSMEKMNSTYLSSEYSGTTEEIIKPITSKFDRVMKNFRLILQQAEKEDNLKE